MYDPAKNTWAEKSRMPDVEDLQAGGTGVTGVINGKLYVVTEGRCTDTRPDYDENVVRDG